MSSSPSSGTYPSIPASDLESRLGKVGLELDNTVPFAVKVISRPLWLGKHEAIALELPHPLPDVFARRREHLLKLGEKDQEKCAAICPEPSGYYVMEFSWRGFTVSVLSLKEFKEWGFTEVLSETQHRTETQLLGLCLDVTGPRRYRSTAFNCQSWTAAVTTSLTMQARAIAANTSASTAVAAKNVAENEITTLQAALQAAHAQLAALKDAKDAVDRENVALKTKSGDEIAALKSALQAAHAQVSALKDAKDVVDCENVALKKESEDEIVALKSAVQAAEAAVHIIKSDTRAETDVLEAKLQASHAEVAAIKEAKHVAECESAAMKASLETAQSEVADLKAKSQSEIADAKRELVGVQAAKDFLERELTARKDADNSNQRELQHALIAKAVAETAAQTAQTTAASLQAELDRVRADKTAAEVAAAVATDRLSARRLGRSTCSGSLSSWVHGVPSAARHADAAESAMSSSSAGNPSDH